MSEHLSEEQITNWLIGEVSCEQHVRECPHCSARIAHTENAFATFRYAMTECSETAPVRREPLGRVWLSVALASLAATVFILNTKPQQQELEAPFLPIPYVAPLALYERTEIQRMDLQVASLTAAGFDVQLADPAATVPAEVLIGQDGSPRAIRIIKQSLTGNN